ncbi:MAG: sigma-54 dependent transcriptional regulator [Pseudomonadota bacterium]|nr:sigma-54 dependent transcriptional regulator [Pseudomonadota bacterium]
MARQLALIVDDEEDLRTLMRLSLMRMGIDSLLAENLAEAKALLSKNRFDICLTDLNLPDGSGLSLVTDLATQYPDLPVAVITAYGSMDLAIEALKAGAFDFVSKPIDMPRLRELVEHALQVHRSATATPQGESLSEQRLIGHSAVMQQLRTMLHKLARSQAPVYISGESGTGKEVVASLIHDLGPRSQAAFVPVNCGAIPAELMESEFFGHKKGSFTGATEDKKGLFQSANGGTLFLDEVADLPLSMQVKLLRAIQEKKIRPIGGQQEIAVDVRLLSATHKNLQQMVEQNTFRQDLFYRINVIELSLPPLREREGDVLLLAEHMLRRICQDWGVTAPRLSDQAADLLSQYHFPGNVRELQNTLERALTLCEADSILPEHLQLQLSPSATPKPVDLDDFPILSLEAEPVPPPTQRAADTMAAPHTTAPEPNAARPTAIELPAEGLENHLQQIEKQIILRALELSHWNRTLAAKKLGMSFRSLRYRLKKLGLGTDDDGDDESNDPK